MLNNTLGLGEVVLSFLLSTGGMIFMGILLLAALVGLFAVRIRKIQTVCIVMICLCLAYAALVVWLSIGFASNSHPPVRN